MSCMFSGTDDAPLDHVAEVVARDRARTPERQLAAPLARRRVGGADQLHAQEGLARLLADEVTAIDRALEVVEERVEPGDMARVHPVGGDLLAIEGPLRARGVAVGDLARVLAGVLAGILVIVGAGAGTLLRLQRRDLDGVVLDPDRAPV